MICHSKPSIGERELGAVGEVLKSGFIAQGKTVAAFEAAFAAYISRRYAVAVNSGTSALHLSLLALKVGAGDEVIVPSYVCTAVLNAVYYTGAIPRVVDITGSDFNISPQSVRKNICRRTKAVIVPHMFGLAADMDELLRLGVPIIEDCALSVGATYRGRKTGSFGQASVISFYATKVITTAEGGMVLTDNPRIRSFIADLREYDNKKSYRLRYNYAMPDISAAMGITQLRRLGGFILRRQKIAKMYNKALQESGLILPPAPPDRRHTYFRYVVRKEKGAGGFLRRLWGLDIEAKRPVYKPLHEYLRLSGKNYPHTRAAYASAVSLPIYPELTDSQAASVIRGVRAALKK